MWWNPFLGAWNGTSLLFEGKASQPDEELLSDASGSWGCGALWGNDWFQCSWANTPHDNSGMDSIAPMELLPIVIAAAIWGPYWIGRTVRSNCDNEAVVSVINSGRCEHELMMHLLRCLFYFAAKYNFILVAKHIPGISNTLADALSRNKLDVFFSLAPQANSSPTPIPPSLLTGLVLKRPDWTSLDWTHWFTTTFNAR